MKLWILRKKQDRKIQEKKQEKEDILKNLYAPSVGRERLLDAFESKIFSIKIAGTGFLGKVSDHSNLKVLTPKQILQRLPLALAQVKEIY